MLWESLGWAACKSLPRWVYLVNFKLLGLESRLDPPSSIRVVLLVFPTVLCGNAWVVIAATDYLRESTTFHTSVRVFSVEIDQQIFTHWRILFCLFGSFVLWIQCVHHSLGLLTLAGCSHLVQITLLDSPHFEALHDRPTWLLRQFLRFITEHRPTQNILWISDQSVRGSGVLWAILERLYNAFRIVSIICVHCKGWVAWCSLRLVESAPNIQVWSYCMVRLANLYLLAWLVLNHIDIQLRRKVPIVVQCLIRSIRALVIKKHSLSMGVFLMSFLRAAGELNPRYLDAHVYFVVSVE